MVAATRAVAFNHSKPGVIESEMFHSHFSIAVSLCLMGTFVLQPQHGRAEERATVICFGDSITKRGYSDYLSKQINVDAINAGVGGNSTRKGLRRLREDVLAKHPNVVVILFGTNDSRVDAPKVHVSVAEYRKNLQAMIKSCRMQNARVILCTLPPIETKAYFTRHDRDVFDAQGGLQMIIKRYRDAAVQVSQEARVSLVDLNQLLVKEPSWLSKDGVHPTEEGCEIIAGHVGRAVTAVLTDDKQGRQDDDGSPGKSVSTLGYVLQADKLAKTQAQAVELLAASGRDLLVIDAAFDGTSRWTASELDSIRKAQPGRKIVSYLSIGEAEDYRPYWSSKWDAGKDGVPDSDAPQFLNGENPDWEGNYKVKYWHPQWQAIITEEIDRIVVQGFDGVYLDIVDAFEFYEYDAEKDDWIDNRTNPETGNTFREDMITWVSRIRKRVDAANGKRLVIPQNGDALLASQQYVDMIDAIGVEDLFTNGKRPQKKSEIQYRTLFLDKATAAHKPVYVIEYPKTGEAAIFATEAARVAGYALLLTDRPLKTLGKSMTH